MNPHLQFSKLKQSNNIVSIYDTNFYILPLYDYLYIIGTIYHCIDGIEPSLTVLKTTVLTNRLNAKFIIVSAKSGEGRTRTYIFINFLFIAY